MGEQDLEHMDYLLTKQAFNEWREKLTGEEFMDIAFDDSIDSFESAYLAKYGLPLDSIIKDL